MKIIILPGLSIGNKESVEIIATGLKEKFDDVLAWNWPHWVTGVDTDFNADAEATKLINLITEPVYIVAKSVGTFVAMKVLQSKSNLVPKLVLNGIPMKGLSDDDKKMYQSQLTNLDPKKLLVIQNQNDHWGKYDEVKDFMNAINPKINVVSKPRDDHSYLYVEDYIRFLL
jgi:predicted alpha/beta hydrolase family esterase